MDLSGLLGSLSQGINPSALIGMIGGKNRDGLSLQDCIDKAREQFGGRSSEENKQTLLDMYKKEGADISHLFKNY